MFLLEFIAGGDHLVRSGQVIEPRLHCIDTARVPIGCVKQRLEKSRTAGAVGVVANRVHHAVSEAVGKVRIDFMLKAKQRVDEVGVTSGVGISKRWNESAEGNGWNDSH